MIDQYEAEKNDPLTRKDLLKMGGQPVWIEFFPDPGEESIEIWALVSVDLENDEIFLLNALGGSSAYEEVCADIRAIYRHPPKKTRKNGPLTMAELKTMNGQPVWLDNSPNGWKCFIINLKYPVEYGKGFEPCGVDLWGNGTSLSLLAECGLYHHPVKETTDNNALTAVKSHE